MVYVGSHSGLVLAVHLDTNGTVQWRTQLPDRVESSPCVSVCGSYIVIGKLLGIRIQVCGFKKVVPHKYILSTQNHLENDHFF